MPTKQDWLDIIEKASEPKKGTKIPKNIDIYALMTLMNPPGRRNGNSGTKPWNTGAGANGIVEPGKATTLDMGTNPPSVYHEGETVYPFPGGKQIVPAKTEQQQTDLGMMQKEKSLPGYATGGTVYDDPNAITPTTSTRPTNIYDLTPDQTMYKSGVNQAFKTTQQRAAGTDPLMENITNRALQSYDTRAAISDTEARQSVVSNPYLTKGAQNAVAAKQQATYRGGLSSLVGDLSEKAMTRAEAANTELYNMGRTGIQDELSKQQFEKTFGESQYQSDIGDKQWQETFGLEKQKYGDQEFSRMADDAQTTSYQTWSKKYPFASESDYTTAREYKARQLQSMDISNATASENLTQIRKSSSWADAQKFLEAEDFANYAALVKRITGKDIDTAAFQADRNYLTTMRAYGIESAALQNQTSRENLNQLRDSAKWDQAQQFLAAGDYENYKALVQEVTGRIITTDEFEADRQYLETMRGLGVNAAQIQNDAALLGISAEKLNSAIAAINNGATADVVNGTLGINLTEQQVDSIATKYNQTVEAGNIELTSARNKLGNEAYASVQEMINGGSSLEAVNARLLEQGKQQMTLAEFQSMVEATPLGERNWGRQMTYANMLLQTQDPNNLVQAQRIFGDMFPSTTFNMDQLISDLGAERYASAMTDMATLSSTFKTWEEAKNSAEGLKLIETLGLGQDDGEIKAKQLFQGLKLNAIDEEWDAIEGSDFYKSLQTNSPDKAELIRNTFSAGLSGELEFDIKPVFNVNDTDGKFVKSFDNVADANKFLGDNADAGYTINESSNYVYKNMASGDTVVVNNGTGTVSGGTPSRAGQTSNKDVGEIYVEGKRMYEVGAGGVINELAVDETTDPWSTESDKMIAQGKADNPYYDKLIGMRADSIVNGDHAVIKQIDDPALLAAVINKADRYNFTFNTGEYKTQGMTTAVMKFNPPPPKDSIVKMRNANGTDSVYLIKSDPFINKNQDYPSESISALDLSNGTMVTLRGDTDDGKNFYVRRDYASPEDLINSIKTS